LYFGIFMSNQPIKELINVFVSIDGATDTSSKINSVTEAVKKLDKAQDSLSKVQKKQSDDFDKSLSKVTGSLKKQSSSVKDISGRYQHMGSTIDNLSKSFKGLVSTLTGHWISKNLQWGVKFNSELIALSASTNKFDLGLGKLRKSLESISSTAAVTRVEAAKMVGVFSDKFFYRNFEKLPGIMSKIRAAVGVNAQKMTEMLGTLGDITQKYPEIQDMIERNSEADKKRLTVLSRQLYVYGKISRSQYDMLRAYSDGEEILSKADRAEKSRRDAQMAALNRMAASWEKLKLKLAEIFAPILEKINTFFDKNSDKINGWIDKFSGGLEKITRGTNILTVALGGLVAKSLLFGGGRGISGGRGILGGLSGGGAGRAAGGGRVGRLIGGAAAGSGGIAPGLAAGAGAYGMYGNQSDGLVRNATPAIGVASGAAIGSMYGGMPGAAVGAATAGLTMLTMAVIDLGKAANSASREASNLKAKTIEANKQRVAAGEMSQEQANIEERILANNEKMAKKRSSSVWGDTAKMFAAEAVREITFGAIKTPNWGRGGGGFDQDERMLMGENMMLGRKRAAAAQKHLESGRSIYRSMGQDGTSGLSGADLSSEINRLKGSEGVKLISQEKVELEKLQAIKEKIESKDQDNADTKKALAAITQDIASKEGQIDSLIQKHGDGYRKLIELEERQTQSLVKNTLLLGQMAELNSAQMTEFASNVQMQQSLGKVDGKMNKERYLQISASLTAEEERLRIVMKELAAGKDLADIKNVTKEEMNEMGEMEAAKQILGYQSRINAKVKERVEIGSQNIRQHDMSLNLAELTTQKFEKLTSLAQNFGMGIAPSVALIEKNVQSLEEQKTILENQRKAAQELYELTGLLDHRKEALNLENQILEKTSQQAQLTKTMRDGWVSALSAMSTGTGRLTKYTLDATKGVSGAFRVAGQVESAMSGSIRKGYNMETGGGRVQTGASRWSASGIGAMSGFGTMGRAYQDGADMSGMFTGNMSQVEKNIKNFADKKIAASKGSGHLAASRVPLTLSATRQPVEKMIGQAAVKSGGNAGNLVINVKVDGDRRTDKELADMIVKKVVGTVQTIYREGTGPGSNQVRK